MSPKQVVVVTGASGFIGAQVVEHLLDAGYAVRGTSRSTKADILRKKCTHPDFEVAVVDDLIKGDLSETLRGAIAVLHLASPIVAGNNHIQVAVGGTSNILRQAHSAEVYKVTIMSSIAATFTRVAELFDPLRVINERDWSTVVADPEGDPFSLYAASKALAERAAWDFADAHPKMNIVAVVPPFVYGPMASSQVITGPGQGQGLSTNRYIYLLISGVTATYPPRMPPQYVDVRDVAKACVLTLKMQPAHPGERRRFLLWGGSFSWTQAAEHVGLVRPELKSRLVDRGETAAEEIPSASIDTSMAKESLGLNEFIEWKQSVEDTVDSLLRQEHMWAKI